MAFNIKSAGLVTTGTTGNDLFVVQSGAVKASTIFGLAGNDNIQAVDGAATATSFFVNAEGGKDVVSLSGGTYEAASVSLGAGADIFSGTFTTGFNNSTIKAGDGNDTINFVSGTFTTSNLAMGGGADKLDISGSIVGSFIGGGAGKDTITVTAEAKMASAQILGGGSDDLITVSGTVGVGANAAGKGLLINGDSNADGGGADTINFTKALSASTIKGKGGKDVIDVAGVAATGAQVLGNAGADSITISGTILGTANLIGAGAGNDTITLTGTTFAGGNSIIGGGGADSITILSGSNTTVSGVIYGGAGADSITILTGGATFVNDGAVAFASLSESTLSKMDVVDGTQTAATGLAFSVSAVTTKLTTGVAGGDAFKDGSKIYDGGFLSADIFKTAAGVTARAAVIDAEGGGLGATFVFEAKDAVQYLFIQGGAAGTADDLVVNLGTAAADGDQINGLKLNSGRITFS